MLADEFFLPTALMHSPFRHTMVSTNLRAEAWPGGSDEERAAYWATLPEGEWGGARLLTPTSFKAA